MAKTGSFFYVKDALYEVVRETLTTEFFRRSDKMWVPCQDNEEGRVSLEDIGNKGQNSKVWTS